MLIIMGGLVCVIAGAIGYMLKEDWAPVVFFAGVATLACVAGIVLFLMYQAVIDWICSTIPGCY